MSCVCIPFVFSLSLSLSLSLSSFCGIFHSSFSSLFFSLFLFLLPLSKFSYSSLPSSSNTTISPSISSYHLFYLSPTPPPPPPPPPLHNHSIQLSIQILFTNVSSVLSFHSAFRLLPCLASPHLTRQSASQPASQPQTQAPLPDPSLYTTGQVAYPCPLKSQNRWCPDVCQKGEMGEEAGREVQRGFRVGCLGGVVRKMERKEERAVIVRSIALKGWS
ncbi:hypothetical protein E2C01_090477 [Portunus trituberculatus]|uniref:Uncharacterized protein n=1 Tax=Portunus trituberculatus TaxID=210409 RepID=A0A5B7JKZ9_PORTR|nr:hypothetical protein [Portunus trituberculatus]